MNCGVFLSRSADLHDTQNTDLKNNPYVITWAPHAVRSRARRGVMFAPLRKNGTVECPAKRQLGRNNLPHDHARVLKKCHAPFPRFGNFAISEQGSGWRKSTREKLVDPVWFNNQGWE